MQVPSKVLFAENFELGTWNLEPGTSLSPGIISAVTAGHFLRTRYGVLYAAWILLCALLFWTFRGMTDSSSRSDRIPNTEASARALQILRANDPARFRDYTAAHTAFAPSAEVGSPSRWIVLCDRRERSGLRDALVVELDSKTGALLRIRTIETSKFKIQRNGGS